MECKESCVDKQPTTDWRDSKPATECLKHLYLSSKLSDAAFSFSNAGSSETLRVHKFVLSMRSEVFEAMFFGAMAEKDNTVRIEDIDIETMKEVLRFIYYDEACLNGDNVMCCLYAAKKYCLGGLVSQCETVLTKSVRPENVCTIYEQAKFYDAKDLVMKCFVFIIKNAQAVFVHSDYLSLSAASMLTIVESPVLPLDEETIFLAVKLWAENKCNLEKEEPIGDNVRKHLGSILYAIRFPLLSSETFASVVSPTGILTQEEEILIFRHIATRKPKANGATAVGKFNATARRKSAQFQRNKSEGFSFASTPQREYSFDTDVKSAPGPVFKHW